MTTKATSTLNVRGIDTESANRIRRAAEVRGLTLAAYLSQLAMLHLSMRALAADGNRKIAAELDALGLGTVTE